MSLLLVLPRTHCQVAREEFILVMYLGYFHSKRDKELSFYIFPRDMFEREMV